MNNNEVKRYFRNEFFSSKSILCQTALHMKRLKYNLYKLNKSISARTIRRRTIRDGPLEKWWEGGGGLFQLVRIFFQNFLLVSIIFLNIIPCSNFFFISTYNFPYWKVSARIFFFKMFWCTHFFLSVSPARFLFLLHQSIFQWSAPKGSHLRLW
jgi:hypothetical protein